MKWLALLLLFANLAVFFFFRADHNHEAVVDLPRPVGAARLILIDELNFTERDSLRLDDPGPQPEAVVPAMQDSFDLMRQPQVTDQVMVTPEAHEPLVEEPDPALEGICDIFRADEPELSRLSERLKAAGLNPDLVEEVVETPGPVMVYILPFDSAREAALELNVLRRENIESFIIADGELQNGISVGVFSAGQNAMARAAQIQALGYQTGEYQYSVEQSQYALYLPSRELVTLAEDYWHELQTDFPSMTREQNSCF